MIKISSITKKFDNNLILNDINLTIMQNSLSIILGESGSGKTTLLNIISNQLKPDSGEVIYEKDDINITYNAVDDMNINILNVLDNIRLVCNDINKINSVLKELGISELKKKKVSKLSKGEQARVSIARAICSSSQVLLFDEPTGNLDFDTAKKVFNLLKEESKVRCIVVATHDKDNAFEFASNLYEINNAQLSILKESDSIASQSSQREKYIVPKFLLFKYTLKKIFSKKILLIFNSLLLICCFFTLSLANTIYNIDFKETIKNSMTQEPLDLFYSRSTNNLKDEVDSFSLTCSSNSNDYNAVFYEDISTKINFKKSIYDYEITQNDTQNDKYYPAIVPLSLIDTIKDENNSNLIKGSVLPLTYASDVAQTKCHFVVVDFIDLGGSKSDNLPIIVPKKSYFDMIELNGIKTEFNSAYYTTQYNKIVKEENSNKDNLVDYLARTYYGQLISFESYSSVVKKYTEMGNSTGFYYVGNIPSANNEIMILSPVDYAKLTGDISAAIDGMPKSITAAEQEFYNKYRDGFESSYIDENGKRVTRNVKIVGAVGYMENGVDIPLNSSDYILGESSFCSSLMDKIKNDNLNIYSNNETYLSKEDIINNFSSFYDGKIKVDNDSYSNIEITKDSGGFVKWMINISILVFIICMISSIIYILNIQKTVKKDLVVMKLNGSTHKDEKRIFLYETFILLFPIILAIPICILLVRICTLAQFSYLSTNVVIVHFGLSYLTILLPIIIYFLIIYIPIYKSKNLKMLDVLKNE